MSSHKRRVSLLAVPVIAIVILVTGMTSTAAAASATGINLDSASGVNTFINDLIERVALRASQRIADEDLDAPASRSSSSSSRSSLARSSEKSSIAPASTPLSGFRSEVFRLVNAERKKKGLPAYTYNPILESSAQDYAEEMRAESCFSHTACGSTLKQRMHASGYYQNDGRSYYYGENIARGQDTAAEAMEDWLNSPSHRDAILSSKFKEIGIGKSGTYWVQHFGTIK